MRLLALAAGLFAATAAADDKPAPAGDLKALIGTWEVKSFTDDQPDDTRGMGRLGVTKAKPGKVPKVVCTGDEIFVLRADGKREVLAGLSNCAWGKFTLDETASPKAIDLHYPATDPKAKAKVYKGIYKIEGKTLTICWGETAPDRPTRFETDAHNNTLVCERLSDEPEKPADLPKK